MFCYCPFTRSECMEVSCGVWSHDLDECAILKACEALAELSFTFDNTNFDRGLRVHVTTEEE